MVGGGRRPARTNEGAASMQKAVVQCIVQDGRRIQCQASNEQHNSTASLLNQLSRLAVELCCSLDARHCIMLVNIAEKGI